jgi:TM2 domain-containing membrane protein YozV
VSKDASKASRASVKSSGLAAVLSFFISGLGQIYNGEILKGLIILLVQVVFIFVLEGIGFVPALIVWVWAIYDAYQEAERINAKRGFG